MLASNQIWIITIIIYTKWAILTNFASAARNYGRRYRKNMAGSAEQRLLDYLLHDYDTDARGVLNASETVKVEIQFLLLRIQGLGDSGTVRLGPKQPSMDERSQVLTTTGLVITEWNDHRLKWNPQKYNNLTDIVVKPHRIWLPELALMNGADELAPDFRKIRTLIRYDGRMHWEPGGIFMTTCDIDIRFFPFDEQACPIMIGAWAYYSARMNLTNASAFVQTHDFKLNGEWDVHKTEASWSETILPCCPNTRYPYVQFTLFLRRRHAFYVMNIILPCSLLSILVMIAFCLPPDAGEKVSLGISVLLAFTVFLLMVAENIPRTSLHIPVIVIYLTSTMALGTVSVCLTVFVLNLHHRDAERPVPRWVRVIVLQYLSKLLCVRARKPKSLAERVMFDTADGPTNIKGGIRKIAKDAGILRPMLQPSHEDGMFPIGEQVFPAFKENKPDISNDWREVAHVMDRLFFWLVFIFMTASALIILLVPMYNRKLIQ